MKFVANKLAFFGFVLSFKIFFRIYSQPHIPQCTCMFAKCVIQFKAKQIYSWHIYCLMQYVWRVSLVSLLLYTSNIVSMQHILQYKSLCTGCKSKLELVLEALYTYTPIPDSYNPNLQNAVYIYAKIMWYKKSYQQLITFWLWNKKLQYNFLLSAIKF